MWYVLLLSLEQDGELLLKIVLHLLKSSVTAGEGGGIGGGDRDGATAEGVHRGPQQGAR